MIKDILQKVERGTGVWLFNEVTQLVERRIPLKSLFVQERDDFGCEEREGGRLRELQ